MNHLMTPGAARRTIGGRLIMVLVSVGCVSAGCIGVGSVGAAAAVAGAPPMAASGHVTGAGTGSSSALSPPLPLPLTVLRPFAPPLQPWLAGNRGVDLAATAGEPVFAAASGTVIYAGELAGRGVLSITHGSLRTTYEPIDPVVAAGDEVVKGQLVGHVAKVADACGPPGSCLHWGAIRGRVYLDPMALLRPPRIRLLPIWGWARWG